MYIKRYRPAPDALLSPRSDIVFKALFTQNSADSNDALRSLLFTLLERNSDTVELQPNEPAANDRREKAVRFDVSCRFTDGSFVEIEMQNTDEKKAFALRAEYLAARLLSHAVGSGTRWWNVKQVYQISILDFIYDKNDENGCSRYCMRKETNGRGLAGILNIVFLELPKYCCVSECKSPENLSKIEKWAIFLREAENPLYRDFLRRIAETEEGIMKAQKVLTTISRDDIVWKQEFDREVAARDRAEMLGQAHDEGLEQGIEQGLEQGIEQGARMKVLETARNLKQLGISVKVIAQATRLTEDEIADL